MRPDKEEIYDRRNIHVVIRRESLDDFFQCQIIHLSRYFLYKPKGITLQSLFGRSSNMFRFHRRKNQKWKMIAACSSYDTWCKGGYQRACLMVARNCR
mmetsp:Transcript_9024/g.12114  ORF Transcript_9024/g.12114 Transcript_9024/m.12114 type:complete len:98 (+) Transcript_9024:240-533(+)